MIGRQAKTAKMLLLEALDPKKRNIEEIIKDAYKAGKSQRGAAKLLGISNTLLSDWTYRLGIDKDITSLVAQAQRAEVA